jgi:LmeA-like phospholipid-binding
MEFITILLSSLIGIVSPAGFVLDRLAEDSIRDRLYDAEELDIRVDNTPSYQIVQGQVDRVRLAGRGLFPIEGVRIDTFEVETDAIAVDPNSLRNGEPTLEKPLQAGVRLVLSREDVNRALQSPEVVERLRDLSVGAIGGAQSAALARYDVINPQVDFLEGDDEPISSGGNRLRFQATLRQQQTQQEVRVLVESGLSVTAGQRLQLTNLIIRVNDQESPTQFSQRLADGLSRRFDLRSLEADGVLVRVLQFEIEPEQVAIAAFVRIAPDSPLLENEPQ